MKFLAFAKNGWGNQIKNVLNADSIISFDVIEVHGWHKGVSRANAVFFTTIGEFIVEFEIHSTEDVTFDKAKEYVYDAILSGLNCSGRIGYVYEVITLPAQLEGSD